MEENKSEICAKLGELLKLTRAGAEIDQIGYDEERDCAYVIYKDTAPYGIRMFNTVGDSGAQLIVDVVKDLLS